jgi:hypothetical protein
MHDGHDVDRAHARSGSTADRTRRSPECPSDGRIMALIGVLAI